MKTFLLRGLFSPAWGDTKTCKLKAVFWKLVLQIVAFAQAEIKGVFLQQILLISSLK